MENDIEYKRMVTIRKIIMIVVIVLLVFCLILFLNISRNKSNSSTDTNYDKNMILLKEGAVKYFTETTIESGDTIISLEELNEKEYVKVLTTSNGLECIDFASFAVVKKIDTKYQLDTVLVCGENNTKVTSFYDAECGGLICEEVND